jgi:signal transduction histidine kinase
MHIVYNLVTTSLKGRIQCDSEPGQGTRFTLEIPMEVGLKKAASEIQIKH